MPDQDIQRHAGEREHNDLGRRGHGEPEREQYRRKHHKAKAATNSGMGKRFHMPVTRTA